MTRTSTLNIYRVTMLLAFAGLGVVAVPAAVAAPATHSGVIKVTCKIVSDASLPVGKSLRLYVSAQGSGAVRSASANAQTTLEKSADSQVVTVMLPYNWTLTDEDNAISVQVSVDSVGVSKSVNAGISLNIPIPDNGATTALFIPVRI